MVVVRMIFYPNNDNERHDYMHIVEDVWANLRRNSRYDVSESDVDHFDPIFDFRVRSGLAKRAVKEVENLVMLYPIAKRVRVEISGTA
jgi:hypothetical protein